MVLIFLRPLQGEVGAAVHLERDDSDILGRKKASYLDYVELWKSVVDPTRLKVTRRTNLLFMCWLAGWLVGWHWLAVWGMSL